MGEDLSRLIALSHSSAGNKVLKEFGRGFEMRCLHFEELHKGGTWM